MEAQGSDPINESSLYFSLKLIFVLSDDKVMQKLVKMLI